MFYHHLALKQLNAMIMSYNIKLLKWVVEAKSPTTTIMELIIQSSELAHKDVVGSTKMMNNFFSLSEYNIPVIIVLNLN